MPRSLTTGFVGLALASLCYGSLWPVTRVAVQMMSPLWFGAIRIGMASVLLALVLAAVGRFRPPPRGDLPIVVSVGFLMLGFYAILFSEALQEVEAGRAAVIGYVTAVFVAPTAALVFGETLRGHRLLGVLAAVGGLAVLFNPLGFDWSNGPALRGNAMLLLAAALWSLVILQFRSHRQIAPSLELVPWQLAIGAACLLVAALVSGEQVAPQTWSLELCLMFAYGIVVGTIGAVWAMTVAMRNLPAVVSSVGVLGAPILSLAISVGLLGEAVTWTLAVGVILILGGIALVSLNPARRQRKV